MINLYSIWNTVMNKQKCIGKTKVLGAFVMLFGFGVAFAQDMIIEPNTDRPGNDYAIFEIEPSPPQEASMALKLVVIRPVQRTANA